MERKCIKCIHFVCSREECLAENTEVCDLYETEVSRVIKKLREEGYMDFERSKIGGSMSYRIYVNDYQCLGNNECPKVLIDELKRQGCEMDTDYCFHNFEIKELEPIIEALEQYIRDMNEWALNKKYKPGSIADFSNVFDESKKYGNGLTWKIQEYLECGYLFVTINFLKAIKDDYEEDYSGDRIIYKIKEGHHVYMSGY